MKAIQFDAAIPRYSFGLAVRRIAPTLLWGGLSCTIARQVSEPELPGAEWVRIATRYGGICGSDLGTIHLHTSPYYSVYSSFPFTFGHENVGRVSQTAERDGAWSRGQRVVVEPILWCRPRGFQDRCEYCARGEINRCLRQASGDLSPGLMIGSCRDTGGSWSPSFIAHRSQLYAVPDSVSDENALLVEPLACGLHAVLQNFPADDQFVAILGAGTIGLCTLAALRALGSKARVLIAARYPFQAQAAARLGADHVIQTDFRDGYAQVAELAGGTLLQPILGKQVLSGGFDLTFECVGSDQAIDDALRLTRPGGRVVLVGVPGIARGIDWTTIFAQELTVRAASMYHHAECFAGRTWRTFDLALELFAQKKLDLSWLITHRYPLDQYGRALRELNQRRDFPVIKAVFDFARPAGEPTQNERPD